MRPRFRETLFPAPKGASRRPSRQSLLRGPHLAIRPSAPKRTAVICRASSIRRLARKTTTGAWGPRRTGGRFCNIRSAWHSWPRPRGPSPAVGRRPARREHPRAFAFCALPPSLSRRAGPARARRVSLPALVTPGEAGAAGAHVVRSPPRGGGSVSVRPAFDRTEQGGGTHRIRGQG